MCTTYLRGLFGFVGVFKIKMPDMCSVVRCAVKWGQNGLRLFRIPAVNKNIRNADRLEIYSRRRLAWIQTENRKLKRQAWEQNLSMLYFKGNDKRTCFYTGKYEIL